MVLGDLGAEVLQIEQPGGGRRARRREAAPEEAEREERRDAAFNVVARNKKSMTLDLRSPEARRILYSLVEGADVLVETNRPGVMKRLGADYDSLKETNHRLIYCSITGYGQSGPYHDLPGHDLNFNAVGGALILSRKDGGAAVPVSLVGYFTSRAVVAVVGILAALLAREKTGRGQHVDIALTDASLYLVARLVSDYLSHGVTPRAGGADLSGSERPFYTVY
jgi:crotonobetainyl-CoA:carnitine CoA-transferase CaiB-like acyl-CoA transferase